MSDSTNVVIGGYKANLLSRQRKSLRTTAVQTALEIIHAHVSTGKGNIEYEMSKLSSYADVIQEALNDKDITDS